MNTPRAFIVCAVVAAWVSLAACEKKSESTPAAPDASGSGSMNRTDMNDQMGGKTPMDQSESSAAIAITAAIRRAIMDDNTMSMDAQNCKIITDAAGAVTLRGQVQSQAEKDSIEAKVKAVPGVTKVDNQLEVASK